MQLCDSCSTGGHRKPSKHYNSLPTPFSSITHSVTTHIIHLLLQLEVLCMLFEQSVCWGWICSPSPQSTTHVPKKFPIMIVFATARNLSIGVILVSWVVSFLVYWEHTHAFTCCSLSLRSSSFSLKKLHHDQKTIHVTFLHQYCHPRITENNTSV